MTDMRNGQSVQWDQIAALQFELTQPEEVREIDYKYVRPFRYFLDLAMDMPAPVGQLRVANLAHLGRPRAQWLEAQVYGRNRSDKKAKKPPLPCDMIFTLSDIDFGHIVPRWYQLVTKLGITCDLIFSINAPGTMFVSHQMFSLASAAEGVHQRLYPEANKPTEEHKRRVDEIVKRYTRSASQMVKINPAFHGRPFIRGSD
jgi:hypothetical protein